MFDFDSPPPPTATVTRVPIVTITPVPTVTNVPLMSVPVSAQLSARVETHALRVRECPATHCKTIDYLEYGDVITTTGLCSGAWLQIRPRGWVNSHYMNDDHCKK